MTKASKKISFDQWEQARPTHVIWEVVQHNDHWHIQAAVWFTDDLHKGIVLPMFVTFSSIEDAKTWIETTGIDIWSPFIAENEMTVIYANGGKGLVPLSFPTDENHDGSIDMDEDDDIVPQEQDAGGIFVWLKKPGEDARKVYVHDIMCEAFVGPRPSPEHVVKHIGGDIYNNKADNLAWTLV